MSVARDATRGVHALMVAPHNQDARLTAQCTDAINKMYRFLTARGFDRLTAKVDIGYAPFVELATRLGNLQPEPKENDVLVVMFSGHGGFQDEWGFVFTDVFATATKIAETLASNARYLARFSEIVVLLDACWADDVVQEAPAPEGDESADRPERPTVQRPTAKELLDALASACGRVWTPESDLRALARKLVALASVGETDRTERWSRLAANITYFAAAATSNGELVKKLANSSVSVYVGADVQASQPLKPYLP